MGLVQKIFGTHSQHELKRIYPIADKVESYREEYGKLSDEQLKGKTKEFKERLAKGETLDDVYRVRYPLYKKYADITVSMELSSIETTVDAIVEKLKLEKQN